MGSTDLGNAPITALLSSIIFIILLYRWPAGAIFYGATVNGIGGVVQYGPIKYFHIVVMLQIFGCCVLAWKRWHPDNIPLQKKPFRGAFKWMLLGIAVLWLRIAIDVLIFGFDQYQSVSLKLGLCQTVLPTILLLLALRDLPIERFCAQISWGMVLQGSAYVAPALPQLVIRESLNLARVGEERLTLYAQDTISGAYAIFLILCGLILIAQRNDVSTRVKVLLGVTLPIVIALLLLNGTRQYLAAGAILILLIWIGSLRQKVYFMFGVGCMIAVTTASFIESVVDTEVGRRLSSSGVREEMYDSRGQIWADALASGGKNFLQGVGFRQFGDILIRREETGEVYEYRDEAHGVFQNIIAEQGYLIGLMMLGMFILALSAIFRNGWVERSDDSYRSIFSIAIALMIPLFFSGTAVNALGLYIFFIVAAAYGKK